MSLLKEFKEFISRGNVMELAVGIIIGGAFGKIVSSLVNDIIMPPIGIIIGGINFTDIKIWLKDAKGAKGAVTINIGNFIQEIINFLIIAAAIFLIVKITNNLANKKNQEPPAPAEPSVEVKLLTEIRDLLKKK